MKKEIADKARQLFGKNKKTVIITVIGFIGIFLIMFSELGGKEKNESKNESLNTNMSTNEYCEYLESRIESIVSSIDGAGRTKVMITVSETTEYIYAENDKENRKNSDSANDLSNQSDYVIINADDNDTGLLLKTIEPKIRGVAIVCDGGNNEFVQQQIYSAVSAVLNISTSKISISKLSASEVNNEK